MEKHHEKFSRGFFNLFLCCAECPTLLYRSVRHFEHGVDEMQTEKEKKVWAQIYQKCAELIYKEIVEPLGW